MSNILFKKTPSIILFIIVFLIILANFLCAETLKLNVGIYQNEPKLYLDDNGIPSGIYVKLLNKIAEEENWAITYVPASWNECLNALRSGKIDILPDMAFSWDRHKEFDFNPTPVLNSWSQAYANPDLNIISLNSISGKRVALLKGSIQETYFTQLMNGYGYTFIPLGVTSFEKAFWLVQNGAADIVIANNFFGEAHYKDYGLTKTMLVFRPVSLYFAVKKGENSDVINTIESYLSNWINKSNSYYYQILSPYLDKKESGLQTRTLWMINILIFLLLLTSSVLILILRGKISLRTKNLIKANQLLEKEKNKFQNYIDHAPFGVFVTNKEGTYLEVNEMACAITGYDHKELLDKNLLELIPPQEHLLALDHFKTVTQTGKAIGIFSFITKNGEERCWTVNAVKINDDSFLGFVNDITEQEKSRQKIDRLSKIFENSLNEIYIFDSQTLNLLEVNPAALDNNGYTNEELKKMTPLDLKRDLKREDFDNLIKPLINHKEKKIVFETRNFRKNGSSYDVEVILQLMGYKNETLLISMVTDITDRKKTERELRKLKENLEQQVEEKTKELKDRIKELEHFHNVTIEREIRMNELRNEIKNLKAKL